MLSQRVKLYIGRARLDRQIAAGHPFEADAELALRARQLVATRSQHQLARNLRGILRYVERTPSRRTISAVVIEPRAVRMGRSAILDLAEQLERALLLIRAGSCSPKPRARSGPHDRAGLGRSVGALSAAPGDPVGPRRVAEAVYEDRSEYRERGDVEDPLPG